MNKEEFRKELEKNCEDLFKGIIEQKERKVSSCVEVSLPKFLNNGRFSKKEKLEMLEEILLTFYNINSEQYEVIWSGKNIKEVIARV